MQKEVTPEGWEDVVLALKGNVENPWAVVNSMINKGYARRNETGYAYPTEGLIRRHQYECALAEANGGIALGTLLRQEVGHWITVNDKPVFQKE